MGEVGTGSTTKRQVRKVIGRQVKMLMASSRLPRHSFKTTDLITSLDVIIMITCNRRDVCKSKTLTQLERATNVQGKIATSIWAFLLS